ncbi:hypothetical protein OCS_01848 [Ophiocordyceps sinensis CO18]|uniref:Uncharacterized protein n=1 Tax=Ophiocordyceps sinensis (strain Co18 / CGMCC 3.14243) TaxID=911162 RepID=T5AJ48_OPHSC|nr:hypothetical protein OCS_01848 [Ophiocordyceps sinensis CO18]
MKSMLALAAIIAAVNALPPAAPAGPDSQSAMLDVGSHNLAANKALVARLSLTTDLTANIGSSACIKVCEGIVGGCTVACFLGGPLDPFCDACVAPAIGTCAAVSPPAHVQPRVFLLALTRLL